MSGWHRLNSLVPLFRSAGPRYEAGMATMSETFRETGAEIHLPAAE